MTEFKDFIVTGSVGPPEDHTMDSLAALLRTMTVHLNVALDPGEYIKIERRRSPDV